MIAPDALTNDINELLETTNAKRDEFASLLRPPSEPSGIPTPALVLMRHEVRTVLRELCRAEFAIEAAAAAAVRLEMLNGAYQKEVA